MTNVSRSLLLLAFVVVITAFIPILGCPTPGGGQSNLTDRVEELEAQVAELQAKLQYVSIQTGKKRGLIGPHLIIEGCNVHIRSGSGDTEDSSGLTGRGNLIIGYNEKPDTVVYGRMGSHNLVVGTEHEYASYGGLVAGYRNTVTGPASSVSGGFQNMAGGFYSSISGGRDNMATGNQSSVTGGLGNTASGSWASVSGGNSNEASGSNSASVSGGWSNEAGGDRSSVSGGAFNTASGANSSVSGGNSHTAAGTDDWAAGGLSEDS